MNRASVTAGRWTGTGLLVVLALVPLALVLYRSVAPEGGFTLALYREVFAEPTIPAALLNTLVISLATVAFSGLLAIPSAWLVARTDVPLARRLRFVLLLPYVIPPYLGAIAWINLANPGVGWLNRPFDSPPLNIYTSGGIIWVLGLFFYTFIYLNCLSAMENADPSLEEAARMSGASPARVLFGITLPLIRPAILSSAFLVFAAAAASYGVPALIGNPGRVWVLTTRIVHYVQSGRMDGHYLAAALSTALMALAVGASLVSERFSHAGRITSMTGKSARVSLVRLGRLRGAGFAFLSAVVFLACVLPLASILATSFMKIEGVFSFSNFTLEKYRTVLFERSDTGRAFLNSFALAFGAATLTVLAGAVLAYLKGHPKMKSNMLIDLCVNLPYATPGTVIALGLVLLWTRPVRLTDTLWILLIAYFVKFLSFAVKALTTNVRQVDPSLEEAARMSGAGFAATVRTIWFPLLLPGMAASWFLVFMPAFGELTMSVLLVGPGAGTVGTLLFKLQEYADRQSANVVAVLILVLIMAAYGAAGLVMRARRGGTEGA